MNGKFGRHLRMDNIMSLRERAEFTPGNRRERFGVGDKERKTEEPSKITVSKLNGVKYNSQ